MLDCEQSIATRGKLCCSAIAVLKYPYNEEAEVEGEREGERKREREREREGRKRSLPLLSQRRR